MAKSKKSKFIDRKAFYTEEEFCIEILKDMFGDDSYNMKCIEDCLIITKGDRCDISLILDTKLSLLILKTSKDFDANVKIFDALNLTSHLNETLFGSFYVTFSSGEVFSLVAKSEISLICGVHISQIFAQVSELARSFDSALQIAEFENLITQKSLGNVISIKDFIVNDL